MIMEQEYIEISGFEHASLWDALRYES
jgi:hypothetical protein